LNLDSLFWVYVAVGPAAWVLCWTLAIFARERMNRLRRDRSPLPDPAPLVSILIPAKDEVAGIEGCVRKVLAQDYPNFRVVVVNDRSTDGTGDRLDELQRELGSRLRVIHIREGELPAGWLGKCNALHVGCRHDDAEWLLFVDSDVSLDPRALSRAMALMVARNYDALSLLTTLECNSMLERLVLPVAAGAWLGVFTGSLTNDDSRPETAVANGQFFLVRRKAYEQAGGHEAVRDLIVEDVELMRNLKAAGFKTRFMMGSELASTRMHTNFRQMLHGWGRIFSGTARRRPGRLVFAIVFLLVSCLSAYPALAWGAWQAFSGAGWSWLAAAGVHFALLTAMMVQLHVGSGNRARDAVWFPVSAGFLIVFLVYAIRMCRTGRVLWRGTVFEQRSLRDAA
jgi:chlorobactene glucosyltransferase